MVSRGCRSAVGGAGGGPRALRSLPGMGGPKMRVQSEAGELSRVGSHEASGLEAGCSSPGRQDGVPDGLDGDASCSRSGGLGG